MIQENLQKIWILYSLDKRGLTISFYVSKELLLLSLAHSVMWTTYIFLYKKENMMSYTHEIIKSESYKLVQGKKLCSVTQ